MIDEVKVRARKSAKHGKTYEYRFEVVPIGGERKWYSKGGFLSEKEARKAGLEELKRYYACGLPERSSNISYADFLDEWMENDCKYNLIATKKKISFRYYKRMMVRENNYKKYYNLADKHNDSIDSDVNIVNPKALEWFGGYYLTVYIRIVVSGK